MKVRSVRTTCALLLFLCAASLAVGGDFDREVTYTGRLTPVMVAGATASEKGFEVTWLLPPASKNDRGVFVVTEDSFALPWLARFGTTPTSGTADGPRIGYHFSDREDIVSLPGATFEFAEKLSTMNEVVEGRVTVQVTKDGQDVNGRKCRVVTVSSPPARRETIAFEPETGLIVRFESDVFLGRGDRFRLTLELKNVVDISTDAARQQVAGLLGSIDELAESADRESGNDLSKETVSQIAEFEKPLVAAAKNTPFESLSTAISRSLAEQRTRGEGITGLSERFIGKPAPPLELKTLAGPPIAAATLNGKVVVLHFWEYDHDQLATPYGQVGYLDHLHRQRGKLGVEVIGIAVNQNFGDAMRRVTAVRSANKLASFMNLKYPIAADDGTLLTAFGDPRTLGAKLPLWVVIGRDGVVRSYKSGLYELNANEGLKELDAIIVEHADTNANENAQ